MDILIAHQNLDAFYHLVNVVGTRRIENKGEMTLAKIVKTEDPEVKEIHYADCKGRIVYAN